MNRTAEFRSQVWSFIRLTRATFLLGGILLFALGALFAYLNGFPIKILPYLIGQIVVTFVQLSAHYSNEYYDIEGDRLGAQNRTWFSGGSGILVEGSLPSSTVLQAGRVCALTALVFSIPAAILAPWMIGIVILSLSGSWFYSAPPLRLMSSGWGELTTSLIVTFLVPAAGYVMQANRLPLQIIPLLLPLLFFHVAMLLSFEFPDRSSDNLVGKKTLAVRLGNQAAVALHNFLIFAGYLVLAIFTFVDLNRISLIWLTLPLGIWQMIQAARILDRAGKASFHVLTTGGLALFALSAFLTLLGLFRQVF